MKEAKRNFHARLSGIIKPLMQKVPLTLLFPAPAVTPPPSLVQAPLVAYERSLEVFSVSGAKKTVVTDKFILENFERLTIMNSEVKEQLKLQGEKTDKLKDMLGKLLSRMPTPHKS